MRSRRVLALAGAVAITATACSSAGVATTTSATTTTSTTVTTTVTVAPTSEATVPTLQPTAAPPSEPVITGDAATNEACRLATVEEISTQVRAGVREVKGLTSPGAYAKTSLTCAWYLDSEDIGIPSVLVQWEFPVTSHHDAVVDLYRSIVKQDLAVKIDGVGDMAILQGNTAEAIDGKRIFRVSVLQHIEPTETDKQDAIALLRLFLERTDQP